MKRAMSEAVDILVHPHNLVAESPVWSTEHQLLWWVDIEGRRLHSLDWLSRRVSTWITEERPGCIALHSEGGLLAAMETGIFHLQPGNDGTLVTTRVSTATHARQGMRFNDGRCDRAGRFYSGTMVQDMSLGAASGVVNRFDAQGLSSPLVSGLITPNGMAFSPDNQIMYLSDSHPSIQRIWTFTLRDDGTLVAYSGPS